ncbi:hypothetical protein FY034_18100 (plasmid) [Trichlorobacter lovleyi]|uniref:hypothetical protein n=1 Tax=Trichlorobacter lovleyi TaxID=313985 RepID=UPI00223F18A4|nr:hypothetical protein [Trichlorobacter lovleyi]QOX80914.1 hypothetical protein FY034_18100 [Trichlorobacter lovleyi]
MNVKYEIKRALVGLAATTLAAPFTAAGICLLLWLTWKGIILDTWAFTAIGAIVITRIAGIHMEDRQLQDILVDIFLLTLLAGFVPGIYLKDLFRVARYPAEDKLVRWFEGYLPWDMTT